MRLSFIQKSITALWAAIMPLSALGFSEYKQYRAHLWELEANSSLYQTQNNYTRSGNTYDSLPNGGRYQLINLDLGARWSMTRSWAVYSGTQIGAAESKDATLTRTTSQFNQVLVGTDFVLTDGAFKLIPDLQFVMPLARVDKNSNNVQTSEGAMEFIGRVIARFDLSRLRNQTFVGMTYRDEGRSTLLNYGAGTELALGNSYLGAEVRGFSTVINDQYTSNSTEREGTALRVNGGSNKFNSLNPSLLDSNYWYRWDNGKWGLQLGAGFSITGASYAAGLQAFANFVYRLHIESERRSAPVNKSDLDRFQEETNDGVDQILFQPPAPPPPPPPPAEPSEAVKKRNRLKDELNKTEMQIELKTQKKRKKGSANP
jgi:hypothetical protein